MSIRKTAFAPGEYYHIYNRGNSKQKIFLSKRDYERFVALLYGVNTNERFNFFDSQKGGGIFSKEVDNPLVSIGAYCLMPNHFHLLITPLSEDGLSKFMQKLSTAYSMYFNEVNKRTGGLFEGKFKSQHMESDRQLKYIFSYIHLNPVKLIDTKWKENGIKNLTKTFEYLNSYPYSSFLDYVGINRLEKKILKISDFPNYFPSKNSFKKEIIEWLNYKEI
ncbi:transposase [Candidatus Nomurabacteria bacterium]|nr:transposase [Candidatus Nomurabacteria bacterium]